MFNYGIRREKRTSRKANADINITPLIDVTMSLLVIFMATAPLMTTGIALDLPKVGGKSLSEDVTSVNISVDKQGYYYVGDKEISQDTLVEKLKAIKDANKDISITISGDTSAEYGRVIGLMAMLKQAGFEKVGLKTEPQKVSKSGKKSSRKKQ